MFANCKKLRTVTHDSYTYYDPDKEGDVTVDGGIIINNKDLELN